LYEVGLADKMREGRPASPSGLLLNDLHTTAGLAHAILCLAVDRAQADDVSRRARRAAEAGKPFPRSERERAAQMTVNTWQIREVLANYLLVDEPTFRQFQNDLRACVEPLLPAAPSGLSAAATTPTGLEEQPDKKPRKRGRPVTSDPKKDARVFDAWLTGSYPTYAALAQELRVKERDVRIACDRERKRRQEKRRHRKGNC
jgi:hypothetical protein